MVMAGVVLDHLEDGGSSMPSGPVRDVFFEVVEVARRYWRDPSPENHQSLARLYDGGRG
jgi:hypothetical protein